MALKFIKKTIAAIEDTRIPLVYYFISFIGWVAFRRFIEIFSDSSRLRFELYSCASFEYYSAFWMQILSHCHHGLYWLQNFLTAAIVLTLATREDSKKVMRAVFFGAFLIIFTPIIDLIANSGRGLNIPYPYPRTIGDFFPIPRDFTIGMKITIVLSLAAAFFFAFIKTADIFKSAISALGFYLNLAFSSILPFILRPVIPHTTTRAFMVCIIIQIIILAWLGNKNFIEALWRDSRLPRVAHYELMFFLGILLVRDGIKAVADEWLSFTLIGIAIFLSWIGAVISNNIVDIEIDRITNPNRPSVTGAVELKSYSAAGWACFGLALCGAFLASPAIAYLILVFIGISIVYSLPPFRLKRILLFSKLMIAAASLLMVIIGYVFAGMPLLRFPRIIIWYFLIFAALALNFIDLKDTAGDKAAGILTIPVVFGEKKAKFIIGLFFIAAYLAAGVIIAVKLNLWSSVTVILLAAGIGLKQFFFFNDKKGYKENRVLLTYLAGLILFLIIFVLRR